MSKAKEAPAVPKTADSLRVKHVEDDRNETEAPTKSFEQEVWETLSRIDVSDHIAVLEKTSKRPEIGYLPWHKAWILTKRKYPASVYQHQPDIIHPDGTMEVEVNVIIQRNSGPVGFGAPGPHDKFFTSARLAVMNQWFSAIDKPNARDINDARQRCLVKALAFAGLGLNLWSESNIPVGRLDDPISTDQYEAMMKLIESTETDEAKFREWCEVDRLADLPYERYQSAMNLLEAKARRRGKAK